jgi:hypothetical protein
VSSGATAVGLLAFNPETVAALLAIPYGVSWILFGIDVLVRSRRDVERDRPAA